VQIPWSAMTIAPSIEVIRRPRIDDPVRFAKPAAATDTATGSRNQLKLFMSSCSLLPNAPDPTPASALANADREQRLGAVGDGWDGAR